jgi:hypothetical protein
VIHAPSALLVHVVFQIARQAGDDLHIARGEELDEILVAGSSRIVRLQRSST